MYFKNFERLRGSEIPDDKLVAADDLLAAFTGRPDAMLGATLVAREAGIALEDAVELLLVAARADVVSIRYELGCTECGSTNQTADDPTQLDMTDCLTSRGLRAVA